MATKIEKKLDDLVGKILHFGQKINRIKLRWYQLKRASDLMRATITDEPGTWSTLWSRKSGKTMKLQVVFSSLMVLLPELARTALAKDFTRLRIFREGLNVAFAGPKLNTAKIPFRRLTRQAKTKEFLDILSSLDISITVSNSEHFELSNGSTATAFSGSETAANEGPGAEVLLVDEAALISPFSMYKILRPMVAHVDGLISLTGTPGRKRCPFLKDIEYNKRKFPHLHQEIPYTEVIELSKAYASYVRKEIDRLPGGIKNPFFRMNFLIEWLIAEGHFVDAAIFIKLATGKRYPVNNEGRLVAGVDWGKKLSSTTATILQEHGDKRSVVDLFEIKAGWEEEFEYLVPFLKQYPLDKIYAEAVGSGDPLTLKLKEEMGGSEDLVEGKFMSAQYKDLIFTNLDALITSKEQKFEYYEDDSPENKSFIRQFLDAEQEVHGKLLSVHKSDEEGSADDFCISTALANDAMNSEPIAEKIDYQTAAQKRPVNKEAMADY